MSPEIEGYAPDFPSEQWSEQDRFLLAPFATNIDGHVSVLRNLPAELVGALCSRASRAKDSLLRVLLKEYLLPIVEGEDKALAEELRQTVIFLRERGFRNIVNNQRAQQFYAKWLAQYGDDSIAQMTGAHLLFQGISQVAIKFIEDQRIGLEPIEKSTRYVNFGAKAGEKYLYYTPKPDLERLGFREEYCATLDHLFDTYVALLPRLIEYLKAAYEEKESILEKKAFDTLRGLLPMATRGQVAFRGNAQAFEYMINRCGKHPLGEFRWIAQAAKKELDEEIPSLLLRLGDPPSEEYRAYLNERRRRVREHLCKTAHNVAPERSGTPEVRLAEYDPEAETKIVAGIIYPELHIDWETALGRARKMSQEEKREVLRRYLHGRKARWHKVGRAFENSYLRFDIAMNIGAYRDLHRHRMHTQERQHFSTHHGYDVPQELRDAKLATPFEEALKRAAGLFEKIEAHDHLLAQYAVPLAYRMRFYQWQNFRQFFWESELRTISQGHPDYRFIEQEKFRLVKEKFPLIAEHLLVDMKDYAMPRRGTEEKIKEKEQYIVEKLKQK